MSRSGRIGLIANIRVLAEAIQHVVDEIAEIHRIQFPLGGIHRLHREHALIVKFERRTQISFEIGYPQALELVLLHRVQRPGQFVSGLMRRRGVLRKNQLRPFRQRLIPAAKQEP